VKFAIIFISIFMPALAFSADNSCSKTRSCEEDKNCKIYAFKHNCHGICQSKTIVDNTGNNVQCPMQCACLKVKAQEKSA
jgi:hypothetical protein